MGQFDYLLGSQQVKLPSPLEQAGTVMTLANAGVGLQQKQLALQQTQQYADAVKALTSGQTPDQIGQQFPLAYAKILADQRQLQYTQAQIGQANAKAESDKSAAMVGQTGVLSNMASGLLNQIQQGQPISQSSYQQVVAQAQHAAIVGGFDPTKLNIPDITGQPQDQVSFLRLAAASGQKPLEAFQVLSGQAKLPGEIGLNTAKTGEANAAAAASPITAAAAQSRAATAAAELPIKSMQYNPFGLPLPGQQSAPTSTAPAPPGPPASPVTAPQLSTLPNGNPGYTPAQMQVGEQNRMAVLQSELRDQQASGRVDPQLVAEIAKQQASMGPQSAPAAPQAPAPQPATPAPSTGPQLPISGRNDAYLASLPPQLATLVKAVSDGRMAAPSGQSLRSPATVQLLSAVGQYDPSFDAANYPARVATREAFTSGTPATMLNAINTTLGHVGNFMQSTAALPNGNFQFFNKIQNEALQQSGDPRIVRAAIDANLLSNEMDKAYRGAGTTDAGIEAMHENMNLASSPAQFQAIVSEYGHLLESKVNALGFQYNKGMGTTASPLQILDPGVQQTYLKLVGGNAAQPGQPAAPGAAPATQSSKPAGQYFPNMPDPAKFAGKFAIGDDGTKYQSTGTNWKLVQ